MAEAARDQAQEDQDEEDEVRSVEQADGHRYLVVEVRERPIIPTHLGIAHVVEELDEAPGAEGNKVEGHRQRIEAPDVPQLAVVVPNRAVEAEEEGRDQDEYHKIFELLIRVERALRMHRTAVVHGGAAFSFLLLVSGGGQRDDEA